MLLLLFRLTGLFSDFILLLIKRTQTMSARPTIFGYGEAMIRYAPISSTATTDVEKGQPELYLRSIGGDELNVMVALARISYSAHWVSVLPNQVLGNVIKKW